MLPTYQRVGSNSSSSLFNRRSYRSWEKCLILLVLVTFGFVCFGGLFFLPDNFGADRVRRVYLDFQKNSPDMFIPAPPHAHGINGELDPHKKDDRAKLAQKINNEVNDILEKPDMAGDRKDYGGMDDEQPIVVPPIPDNDNQANNHHHNAAAAVHSSVLTIDHGEDSDPEVQEKRNTVKKVSLRTFSSFSTSFNNSRKKKNTARECQGILFLVFSMLCSVCFFVVVFVNVLLFRFFVLIFCLIRLNN